MVYGQKTKHDTEVVNFLVLICTKFPKDHQHLDYFSITGQIPLR
jgi:hypothetical protein